MKQFVKGLGLCLCGLMISAALSEPAEACTRALYKGENGLVITGRTMDWMEDMKTNLYLLPRGIERRGAVGDKAVVWKAKYGSIVASGYEIGTADGMNEKGLVANALYLAESSYQRPGDNRPELNISLWAQYVLDNFATVEEAVQALSQDLFQVIAPQLPNGSGAQLHLSISDPSGNSAIFEYFDGKIVVHAGPQYVVMTNSPRYDKQITLNDYWQQIGGLVMLPGTNRASDRFVRASFYIGAIPKTGSFHEGVAGVFSVMRNVSVPLGISTPNQPNIASTIWRTVSDQTNKVYYYESTLSPNIFWINLADLNFAENASVKKLALSEGQIYAGNASAMMVNSKPFVFMIE